MFADRITHFLWASVILSCYLARERRLEECFAIAGSAIRLAFACGISPQNGPVSGINDSNQATYLLPPPEDEAEAMDRIRLAHAMYLMDQVAPVLSGPPTSFPYDPRWTMTPRDASIRYQYGEGLTVREEQISEFWQSDAHFKVLLARTFDKVMTFAQLSLRENGHNSLGEEYRALETRISSQHSTIPPLFGSREPQSSAGGILKGEMLSAHTAMYGNGLLLHTVRAGKDPAARRNMLECLDALLRICENVREHKRLERVRAGIMNAAFMMNAVRVVARELQRPEARKNVALSTHHCYSIDLFLDIIEDITFLNPAWADTPLLIKDTLTAALNSVMAPS
ncbi:hypothetical protein DL93DRAFT_414389 [Clavulina sp. PMI_390]|nr:hypothetical protein DL93DRAFT_414389 [Clavulina sp. PMI_390]